MTTWPLTKPPAGANKPRNVTPTERDYIDRFVDRENGIYASVKDFGAVGDGATDDSAAVRAAYAAVVAAGGGVLFFPPGVYLLTGSVGLTLTAGVYVEIRGAGRTGGSNPDVTTLKYTGTGTAVSAPGTGQDWGCIKDLNIQCTAAAATTGVKIVNTSRGFLDNVRILGNNYHAGSRGIWYRNSFGNYLYRCVIEGMDTDIDLDGTCNDTSITDCNLGGQTACIRVKDSDDVRIRGGQHSGTGSTVGCVVLCTASALTSGGCSGFRLDEVHHENNGLDLALGRAADGSTKPIRSPVVNTPLPNGGYIEQCTNPTLLGVAIGTTGTLTLTSACSEARFVGIVRNNGTIVDSSVRSTSDTDLLTVRVGGQVPLDILGYPRVVSSGNWDTLTQDSGMYYGGYRTNAGGTPAIGDNMNYQVFLPSGTYALDCFWKQGPNGGQVGIVIDGVLYDTIEGYAASPTAQFQVRHGSGSDLVIPAWPTAGNSHTVAFNVSGKHASSSGYVARLTRIVFRRTA